MRPLYYTTLSADSMYYHAARRALARAIETLPKLDAKLAEARKYEAERQEILGRYGNDAETITNIEDACRLETIEVFISDYLHGAVEMQYSPFIENVAVTHLLCAASLESFINIQASDLLPKESFRQFEKSSLEGKWLFLPKLLGAPGYQPGAEPYQTFSKLIGYRNSLAHFKNSKAAVRWGDLPEVGTKLGISKANGEASIATVQNMINEFCAQLKIASPIWLTQQDDINYFEFNIDDEAYREIVKMSARKRSVSSDS